MRANRTMSEHCTAMLSESHLPPRCCEQLYSRLEHAPLLLHSFLHSLHPLAQGEARCVAFESVWVHGLCPYPEGQEDRHWLSHAEGHLYWVSFRLQGLAVL